jgi:hypothetical protein
MDALKRTFYFLRNKKMSPCQYLRILCAFLLLAGVFLSPLKSTENKNNTPSKDKSPSKPQGHFKPHPHHPTLMVFVVNSQGVPQIADVLRMKVEKRIEEGLGKEGSADHLTYRFTPHAAHQKSHWWAGL